MLIPIESRACEAQQLGKIGLCVKLRRLTPDFLDNSEASRHPASRRATFQVLKLPPKNDVNLTCHQVPNEIEQAIAKLFFW